MLGDAKLVIGASLNCAGKAQELVPPSRSDALRSFIDYRVLKAAAL